MKSSKSLLTFGLTCAALTFSLAVCAKAQTVNFIAQFHGNQAECPIVDPGDGR